MQEQARTFFPRNYSSVHFFLRGKRQAHLGTHFEHRINNIQKDNLGIWECGISSSNTGGSVQEANDCCGIHDERTNQCLTHINLYFTDIFKFNQY